MFTIFVSYFQAGIIEEMLEDTFESLEDQEELDEAAQEEVDKVLFEITAGKLEELYFLMTAMHGNIWEYHSLESLHLEGYLCNFEENLP